MKKYMLMRSYRVTEIHYLEAEDGAHAKLAVRNGTMHKSFDGDYEEAEVYNVEVFPWEDK